MPLTFQEEPLNVTLPEAEALTLAHWREICADPARLPLSPDRHALAQLEARGATQLITARQDGALVGYLLWLHHRHLHYDRPAAVDDLHFLHPDARRGSAGYRLLQAAVDAAEQRGARHLSLRCKLAHDHRALFAALGFIPTDLVATKVLG